MRGGGIGNPVCLICVGVPRRIGIVGDYFGTRVNGALHGKTAPDVEDPENLVGDLRHASWILPPTSGNEIIIRDAVHECLSTGRKILGPENVHATSVGFVGHDDDVLRTFGLKS